MGLARPHLTISDGAYLAERAAGAIYAVLHGQPLDGRLPTSLVLRALGSCFVTVRRYGELRGCIGSLDPMRPLYRDAAHNAERATGDPRTPPMVAAEWPELEISVTVLGPAEPLPVTRRSHLRRLLRPGVDGLTIEADGHRATFLPAVWERLPDVDDFVSALLIKGEWPARDLPSGVRVFRYTATEFHHPVALVPLAR